MITQVRYPGAPPAVFEIRDRREHIQKNWVLGQYYETQRNGMLNHMFLNSPKNPVILDIGASIGNHTIFFAVAMNASKVYSFEPSESSYDHLKANIEANNLTNVNAINVALGDHRGTVSMRSESDVNVGMKQVDENGSDVDLITLDSLEFEKIDIVKIDVEHYNRQLLNGAVKTFEKHKPNIYIEAETQDVLSETDEILSRINYKRHPKLVFNHTPTYLYTWQKNA